MSQLSINDIDPQLLMEVAADVATRCDQLATHSRDSNGLTRVFCSPAMKTAHAQTTEWMQAAKMTTSVDAVGNLIGQLDCNSGNELNCNLGGQLDRDVFMVGSHLDTVVNAGRFDGMLGAMLGIGIADVIHRSKLNLNFNLHVVGFSEEEGVRYKMPFIGSRGIAGTFDVADLDRIDEDGVTMRDALVEFGCKPDEFKSASYADRNLIGFMEAHIEQAVLLEEANVPVGVVGAIAGQTRATIAFSGCAGHAGTVPHDQRSDALAAAAELILEIEKHGQTTTGLFATVGNVEASPGLSNVISGYTELRLDLRHEIDATRTSAFRNVKMTLAKISKSRGVTGEITSVQHTPAVPMDRELTMNLIAATAEADSKTKPMISGAGHDAMIMSQLAPSCMLFVRCRDGVSHHPDEYVTPEDIGVALKVMIAATLELHNSRLKEN